MSADTKSVRKDRRKERLAEALRANLKRRKAQIRKRDEPSGAEREQTRSGEAPDGKP